jgi:hypothetical protein
MEEPAIRNSILTCHILGHPGLVLTQDPLQIALPHLRFNSEPLEKRNPQ